LNFRVQCKYPSKSCVGSASLIWCNLPSTWEGSVIVALTQKLGFWLLSSFFLEKAQGKFSLVHQGGSGLHIKMATLCSCQFFGTLGYDIEKCKRCEKILCNRCPLKHEGKIGSGGWDVLRVSARTRTNTIKRPRNQGRIYMYIYDTSVIYIWKRESTVWMQTSG